MPARSTQTSPSDAQDRGIYVYGVMAVRSERHMKKYESRQAE